MIDRSSETEDGRVDAVERGQGRLIQLTYPRSGGAPASRNVWIEHPALDVDQWQPLVHPVPGVQRIRDRLGGFADDRGHDLAVAAIP